MVLVPEEVMNLIQQRTDLQTSPLLKSMSALNQQMSQTLADPNVPDDLKLKTHEQQFQRFLNLQQQRESYVPTVKIQSDTTSTQGTQQTPQESQPQQQEQKEVQSVSDSEIVKTVPKRFQSQAEGLLQWIKKSPQTIQWDDKGVVSLGGKPIPGSSITDLVNDVLRSRRTFAPTGRDDFTRALAQLNTPEDFIRNEDRRKLMTLFKTGNPPPLSTPTGPSLVPTPPSRPRKRPMSPSLQRRRVNVPPQRGLQWISYKLVNTKQLNKSVLNHVYCLINCVTKR